MYIVISRWSAKPGNEALVTEQGVEARARMRAIPGVKMIEGIEDQGEHVVFHAYDDQATYDRIVNDPDGPFSKLMADMDFEAIANWNGSWRGEALK
jgi:hypothetical protein